ncbi:MAG: ketol-acid reductoisomerase [Candidatus Bathyarchaeia archaeon]
MAEVFYDKDAELSVLNGLTVAILGYGNQGRAWALNMRDSGIKVLVGNIRDEYWFKAEEDGFKVLPLNQASADSNVICLLLPDELQPIVYREHVEANLAEGKMLVFAHGFSVRYGLIKPPVFVDVALAAPRMIGSGVRRLYTLGSGAPALLAVKQDYSGMAWRKLLALAKALGFTRVGALKSSFEEETELDLFTEQAVMPIILSAFINAFEILSEAGYSSEAIILELLASGELIEVFRQVCKLGLMGQLPLHSRTSQYGQLSRIQRFIGIVEKPMRLSLEEIRSGSFSTELILEQKSGYVNFRKLMEEAVDHPLCYAENVVKSKVKIPYEVL